MTDAPFSPSEHSALPAASSIPPGGDSGFEPGDAISAALGPERATEWRRPRGHYDPVVTTAEVAGGLVAALLATKRPHTIARKIVDLWFTDDTAARSLVDELIAASAATGDACVKWEVRDDATAELAVAAGFDEMAAPYESAEGTTGVRGFVRWHRPFPHPDAVYYGQTTMFTCGAVAALVAAELAGSGAFDAVSAERNRERELAFWRQATNFPACEPVGLAVALGDQLGTVPEVYLDSDGPALLEFFEEDGQRAFREVLQAESRVHAAERGIAIVERRIGVDELAERITGGSLALLLIDDGVMHGGSGPHWVLAYAVRGDEFLIDDPWIESDHGETWVDAHRLPVAAAGIDRMAAWGDPSYRGVVFLPAR